MLSTRRDFLQTTGCGFGYLAWQAMAQSQASLANPLANRRPHHQPKAKRVIFLFMKGGPSHLDTFEPKPLLDRDVASLSGVVERELKIEIEKVIREELDDAWSPAGGGVPRDSHRGMGDGI